MGSDYKFTLQMIDWVADRIGNIGHKVILSYTPRHHFSGPKTRKIMILAGETNKAFPPPPPPVIGSDLIANCQSCPAFITGVLLNGVSGKNKWYKMC